MLRPIICIDFDGTLCDDEYPAIGNPKHDMIMLLDTFSERGYYIIVNSSRRSLEYDIVRDFLIANRVAYDQLCLGAKPVADIYIDDKGLHGTPRFLDMFVEYRFLGENYLRALASEHLDSAFAQNMYAVPEVGKVDATEPRFRIALAMTGGMDSTTMWRMVEDSGVPYRMLYFDMGQSYALAEQKAIKAITGKYPEIYSLDLPVVTHAHIISGRNASIILSIAQLLHDAGQWGDIWFGNVAGESPIMGGDKSHRFFNDMNALLVHSGYDSRIVNPLMGLDKTDEVLYWKERGDVSTLMLTKSCFDKQDGHCGKCQACFLKWAAFISAGVTNITAIFPVTDFAEHVQKYERVMHEASMKNDFSHYSPRRIHRTQSAIRYWKDGKIQ